jgi:uncharacterized membrane protein YfcA
MEYALIAGVTLLASVLTFFSGFGLGTVLLPVFILFFPVEIAVAATAVVHLANNLFKAGLMGRKANYGVVVRFSVPAAAFAVLGALLLTRLSDIPPIATYVLADQIHAITPMKLMVGTLMLVFAALEFIPAFTQLAFPSSLVPLGGVLSGFFGGLTGHQGALRSAFLIRLGLDKETFVGTTILCALVIDLFRLGVYGAAFATGDFETLLYNGQGALIAVGIVSACVGAVLGARLIKKVTMEGIQRLVGILLLGYAVALASGLI